MGYNPKNKIINLKEKDNMKNNYYSNSMRGTTVKVKTTSYVVVKPGNQKPKKVNLPDGTYRYDGKEIIS